MEKDILSLFVSNRDTVAIVKKLFRFAMITLTCNIIYSVLDLMDWYRLAGHSLFTVRQSNHYFYTYTVRPGVGILLIAFSLIGHVLNYKGYERILLAVKESDQALLNKGFGTFYITYILAVVAFIISIASVSYRLIVLK